MLVLVDSINSTIVIVNGSTMILSENFVHTKGETMLLSDFSVVLFRQNSVVLFANNIAGQNGGHLEQVNCTLQDF